MKKNGKQMAALALALGMTAGGMGSIPALASAPTTASDAVVESLTDGKGTMSMTLEGTIKATQVKVTVPLKAAFDIDPGKCSAALATADGLVNAGVVTQASNYTITNGSVMPVWVYISGIEAKTGGDLKDIDLVNTKTDLQAYTTGGNNKVMIAMKDAALEATIAAKKITEVDGAQFWLSATKPTGNNYYMDADHANVTTSYGKLDEDGGTKDSMTLHVYALTKGTWSDGMKFAVTPTFTVSATDPSVPAT